MNGAPGGPDGDEQLPDDRLVDLVRAKAAEIRSKGLVPPELEERLDARARAMGA